MKYKLGNKVILTHINNPDKIFRIGHIHNINNSQYYIIFTDPLYFGWYYGSEFRLLLDCPKYLCESI